jgi:hypothetical protein
MQLSNPVFSFVLAGSISSKLLQAHLNYLHTHSEGIKGVDGRCLANLTWALAKLDLSSDDSALTTELALMVAPFIIRTLDTSSPQVSSVHHEPRQSLTSCSKQQPAAAAVISCSRGKTYVMFCLR